jgi:hypothetical protein
MIGPKALHMRILNHLNRAPQIRQTRQTGPSDIFDQRKLTPANASEIRKILQ